MKAIAAGYVKEISQRSFLVRLTTDLTKKQPVSCDLEAQVSVRKLTPRERVFLREGAYFTILKGGTFRFSRLRWKKREIAAARKRAAQLFKKIGWR